MILLGMAENRQIIKGWFWYMMEHQWIYYYGGWHDCQIWLVRYDRFFCQHQWNCCCMCILIRVFFVRVPFRTFALVFLTFALFSRILILSFDQTTNFISFYLFSITLASSIITFSLSFCLALHSFDWFVILILYLKASTRFWFLCL